MTITSPPRYAGERDPWVVADVCTPAGTGLVLSPQGPKGITLIAGAPCSGKTTWAKGTGVPVLDWDELYAREAAA